MGVLGLVDAAHYRLARRPARRSLTSASRTSVCTPNARLRVRRRARAAANVSGDRYRLRMPLCR